MARTMETQACSNSCSQGRVQCRRKLTYCRTGETRALLLNVELWESCCSSRLRHAVAIRPRQKNRDEKDAHFGSEFFGLVLGGAPPSDSDRACWRLTLLPPCAFARHTPAADVLRRAAIARRE